MSTLRIHTAIAGAFAIATPADYVVTATWKETKNQSRKERAVIVPGDYITVDAGEFTEVVQKALKDSAEAVLKQFVNENENAHEISLELFGTAALCEEFLSGGGNWIGKKELEQYFCAGETWKCIVARPDYSTNPTIRRAAEHFKENVLKCSGKVSMVSEQMRNSILAKLTSDELGSEWGSFICKRFKQMEQREKAQSQEISLDAL